MKKIILPLLTACIVNTILANGWKDNTGNKPATPRYYPRSIKQKKQPRLSPQILKQLDPYWFLQDVNTDYLPLAGGTLTGALTGTSASFNTINTNFLNVNSGIATVQTTNNYDGNIRLVNSNRGWLVGMLGSPGSEQFNIYDMNASASRMMIDNVGNTSFAGNITLPNGIYYRAKRADGIALNVLGFDNNTGNLAMTISDNLLVKNTGNVPVMTLSWQGHLSTIGSLTAPQIDVANGNYFRAQRNSGGAYINTLGYLPGTDDLALSFSNTLRIRSTSTTDLLAVNSIGNMNIGGNIFTQRLRVEGNIDMPQGHYITWNNGDAQIKAVNGYHLTFSNYNGSSMVENMRIQSNGNVGIGSSNPGSKLSLTGANSGGLPLVDLTATGTGPFQRGVRLLNGGMNTGDHIMYAVGRSDDTKNMGQTYFYYAGAGSDNNRISMGLHSVDDVFNILATGNVGIGTTTPSEKLSVNGNVRTKKLIVTQTGWPDYVFHKNYHLQPLSAVEDFIQKNNHLPGIPSAKEVEQKGLDVGDTQALLLKKIEELTLHIIAQEKRIKALEQEQAKKENKSNKKGLR